jgi:hypothetical protein
MEESGGFLDLAHLPWVNVYCTKAVARVLKAELAVSVSARRLWRAWTEPRLVEGWYADEVTGEPKAGTYYTWRFEGFGPPQALEVKAVEPERRLLLAGTGFGEIEVLFADSGRLTLAHSGLPFSDEVLDDCQSGWRMALAILGHYVESYFEQPKQTLLVMHEAAFDFGRALKLFAEPKHFRRWFEGPEPPRDILVDTGREVCRRWDYVGGILETKAFHWGDGKRFLALRALSWARGYDLGALRGSLEASLRNLTALLAEPPEEE